MKGKRDHSLDNLLDLDGQTFFIDPKHYVRFVVRKVEPTPERPQGLNYSLTLHDENGERLVGFDNAHSVQTTKGPVGRSAGSMITGTAFVQSGHTNTKTPRRC